MDGQLAARERPDFRCVIPQPLSIRDFHPDKIPDVITTTEVIYIYEPQFYKGENFSIWRPSDMSLLDCMKRLYQNYRPLS